MIRMARNHQRCRSHVQFFVNWLRDIFRQPHSHSSQNQYRVHAARSEPTDDARLLLLLGGSKPAAPTSVHHFKWNANISPEIGRKKMAAIVQTKSTVASLKYLCKKYKHSARGAEKKRERGSLVIRHGHGHDWRCAVMCRPKFELFSLSSAPSSSPPAFICLSESYIIHCFRWLPTSRRRNQKQNVISTACHGNGVISLFPFWEMTGLLLLHVFSRQPKENVSSQCFCLGRLNYFRTKWMNCTDMVLVTAPARHR